MVKTSICHVAREYERLIFRPFNPSLLLNNQLKPHMGEWNLGWRTRAQLMKLHNNNDAVVDSIVERKIQLGEYKEHPDCPDEESAIMYWAMLDITQNQEEEAEEKIAANVNMNVNLGTEAITLGYGMWYKVEWEPIPDNVRLIMFSHKLYCKMGMYGNNVIPMVYDIARGMIPFLWYTASHTFSNGECAIYFCRRPFELPSPESMVFACSLVVGFLQDAVPNKTIARVP